MPSPSWEREIHERLLARDPTAPAELAETLLPPLVRKLRHAHRVEEDLLADAVVDALMGYLKSPEKFDPQKRSLSGYLLMAATGDLRNALDKRKRRKKREVALEDLEPVEMHLASRNRERSEAGVVARMDGHKLGKKLDELFPSPTDRLLVELVVDKERKTEPYARILGLEKLPLDAQRREVKRHKDRIKKRLERYGQEIRRA